MSRTRGVQNVNAGFLLLQFQQIRYVHENDWIVYASYKLQPFAICKLKITVLCMVAAIFEQIE